MLRYKRSCNAERAFCKAFEYKPKAAHIFSEKEFLNQALKLVKLNINSIIFLHTYFEQ